MSCCPGEDDDNKDVDINPVIAPSNGITTGEGGFALFDTIRYTLYLAGEEEDSSPNYPADICQHSEIDRLHVILFCDRCMAAIRCADDSNFLKSFKSSLGNVQDYF